MYQLDKKIIREIKNGGCFSELLIIFAVGISIVCLLILLVNWLAGNL